MQAGVAGAEFTPEPGLVLQGHLSRNPSHAVLYPLEARAIVFDDNHARVCIITLDVIGVELAFTQRVRQQVSAKTGIRADHILIAASHTHCAPAMLHNLAMTPDSSFVQHVERAAVQCAIEAAKHLHPVTLGLGCGSAHFNVNRRPVEPHQQFGVNWAGVVDHRARVLRVDGLDERPLAMLFHFSCHPTTKQGSEGFISADYPGAARRLIEEQLQCPALFLPGCFGNVRPQINGAFTSANKEQLDAVGRQLAQGVMKATRFLATRPASGLSAQESELYLAFRQSKAPEELEVIAQGGATLGAQVKGQWARRTLDAIRSGSLPQGLASVMQVMKIGPLMLVAIPGEPVQEIGYAIERTLAHLDGIDDLWPMGYCNDQIGYLVTERQKQEGGYEPNAYTFYDRPAGYVDEERVIVELAGKLCSP